MKKTAVLAVTLAIALAIAIGGTTVWSQGGRPMRNGQGGPGGPGGFGGMTSAVMAVAPPQSTMLDREAQMLGLTEEQVAQLKPILTNGEKTIKPLSQKAADASKALREAVLAKEFDNEKVKTLTAAAQKAELAVINAEIDEWSKIRPVLTADQIATLQKMGGQRPPMMGGQGGPMGPPPRQ